MMKTSFSIDHIAFCVHSITQSIDFYKLLGFDKVKEWRSDSSDMVMVLLKNYENIFIELVFCNDNIPLPEHAKDYRQTLFHIGIKHLALRVESVDSALDYLIRNGIQQHSSIQMGKLGRRYFIIHDPDGAILEFTEENLNI